MTKMFVSEKAWQQRGGYLYQALLSSIMDSRGGKYSSRIIGRVTVQA